MADSFELSHVPQQSRRQKLRVGYPESHLLQLHDQPISLMSPYLLSCANPDISILNGSKFLKPAQELLDGICDVGFVDRVGVGCGLVVDPTLVDYRNSGALGGGVDWSKRSRLISLLDEVYTRYKQYYRQIQTVITSFDVVAGATPFATLDLNTMSKHFHYLNNAITNQIQLTNKPSYGQRVVNNTDHQPLWRPQRGLPKQAVTVLRAWLFDHFLHPYPTDTDKQWLATQTGLTRNQVSNWFINARVRVWKPMVEEVHTLETKQQVPKMLSEHETSRPSLCPTKRDHHTMEGNKEDMNFCDSFSIYRASANRGVSLTLGLHQNNNAATLPLSVGYEYMY